MTGFEPAAPTLQTVTAWYGIQPAFAHAVLQAYAGADYEPNIGDIHQLLDRYDSLRIQLEYAFSTEGRARHLASRLREWGVNLDNGSPGSRSFLDIGCAYAGFLVVFAQLGYDVTGVELEERYAKLGRVNLQAAGLENRIRMGNFLTDDLLPPDQKFDLIICNDVIEHVSDPASCLQKICGLLKPGGFAYIASPNKLSIPNVRADVHFQRFGLTLLDYFRARAAHAMYSGLPQYEVSDFYEPEWYVNTMQAAGGIARVVYDATVPPADIPGEIGRLYSAFADWATGAAGKLDPLMRHEITREFTAYSARMFEDYHRHATQNSLDLFAHTWVDPLTRVLVQMPGSGAGTLHSSQFHSVPADTFYPAASVELAPLPLPAAPAGKDTLHAMLDVLQRITPEPVRAAVRKHYLNHFYFHLYPEKRK